MGRRAALALAGAALLGLTSCAPSDEDRARAQWKRDDAACAVVADLNARLGCYSRAFATYRGASR